MRTGAERPVCSLGVPRPSHTCSHAHTVTKLQQRPQAPEWTLMALSSHVTVGEPGWAP